MYCKNGQHVFLVYRGLWSVLTAYSSIALQSMHALIVHMVIGNQQTAMMIHNDVKCCGLFRCYVVLTG